MRLVFAVAARQDREDAAAPQLLSRKRREARRALPATSPPRAGRRSCETLAVPGASDPPRAAVLPAARAVLDAQAGHARAKVSRWHRYLGSVAAGCPASGTFSCRRRDAASTSSRHRCDWFLFAGTSRSRLTRSSAALPPDASASTAPSPATRSCGRCGVVLSPLAARRMAC